MTEPQRSGYRVYISKSDIPHLIDLLMNDVHLTEDDENVEIKQKLIEKLLHRGE